MHGVVCCMCLNDTNQLQRQMFPTAVLIGERGTIFSTTTKQRNRVCCNEVDNFIILMQQQQSKKKKRNTRKIWCDYSLGISIWGIFQIAHFHGGNASPKASSDFLTLLCYGDVTLPSTSFNWIMYTKAHLLSSLCCCCNASQEKRND